MASIPSSAVGTKRRGRGGGRGRGESLSIAKDMKVAGLDPAQMRNALKDMGFAKARVSQLIKAAMLHPPFEEESIAEEDGELVDRVCGDSGPEECGDVPGALPTGARVWTSQLERSATFAGEAQLLGLVATPPDGLCLSYCCCGAADLRSWEATRRDRHGFIADAMQEAVWKSKAQTFLAQVISLLEARGREARAEELRAGAYPGDEELHVFAEVLGFGIVVEPADSDAMVMPALIFGSEPVKLKVKHCYTADGEGHQSGHYVIAQVWSSSPQASDDEKNEASEEDEEEKDVGEDESDLRRAEEIEEPMVPRKGRSDAVKRPATADSTEDGEDPSTSEPPNKIRRRYSTKMPPRLQDADRKWRPAFVHWCEKTAAAPLTGSSPADGAAKRPAAAVAERPRKRFAANRNICKGFFVDDVKEPCVFNRTAPGTPARYHGGRYGSPVCMWCSPEGLRDERNRRNITRSLMDFQSHADVLGKAKERLGQIAGERAVTRALQALRQRAAARAAKRPAAEAAERPRKRFAANRHICKGFLVDDVKEPCVFNRTAPGTPARYHGGRYGSPACMWCSEKGLRDEKNRGNIARSLIDFQSHADVLGKAKERLQRIAGEEAARAAKSWQGILEYRRRALAPARTASGESESKAERRKAYARNRFFPKLSNKRRLEHSAWETIPAAADAEEMSRIASKVCPGGEVDDAGLPYAHHYPGAVLFQKWCRSGSWTSCATCHRLCPQKYKAAKRFQAESKQCRHCQSGIGYPVWQPSDRPRRLRKLTREMVEALRPLDLDCGPFEKIHDGYRAHTGMMVFRWSTNSVESKIEDLPRRSRHRARKALEYLMEAEDSSYGVFYKEHERFLRKHDNDDDDAKRKRPLNFIERLGVECARWPHLYWTTEMCETFVRQEDARRQRRLRETRRNGSEQSGDGDETEDVDGEAPKKKRQSLKASFLAKLLGPIVGYSEEYDLFQFVYDLHTWTTLGAKKHVAPSVPMRILAKGASFTPGFWKLRHAALLDCQRQLGYPDVFFTIAPYEWSFPYHQWLVKELEQTQRERQGLPTQETLHRAHVFSELVRNWLTGLKNVSEKNHVLSGTAGDGTDRIVQSYFARFEYQDGKRKEGTQQYHGSGREHLHVLLWLKPGTKEDFLRHVSATIPEGLSVEFSAYVLGSQPSRGESGWPLWSGENQYDGLTHEVRLKHTAQDRSAGLRAYFPAVMEALRCHQDVLMVNKQGLLMKYVAKYVPKFSDSFANEWLSDHTSDYTFARKILFDYHPLEPEMILQMANQQIKISFASGTTQPIFAPYPNMPQKPKFVELYEASEWRGDDMSLLEFLRKSNTDGRISNFIQVEHKRSGGQDSLEAFARTYPTKGEKLIAAETYWRMNDLFYGQWLALRVPFRRLNELDDAEVRRLVPQSHHYLAVALRCRPDVWRNLDAVKEEMQLEAVASKTADTILSMLRARTHLIDAYLSGSLSKDDEPPCKSGSGDAIATSDDEIGEGRRRAMPEGMQIVFEKHIMDHAKKALEIEQGIGDENEELLAELAEHAKPVVGLGPPGTGKSFVIKRCARAISRRGGKVLLAVPTGQLQSRLRSELEGLAGLDIDTCHSAFLLHKPEQESLPLMAGYSMVVIDEFPQLSKDQFERVIRIWQANGKVPALVFAGDFHQLPSVSGSSPKDSLLFSGRTLRIASLHESWRSDDESLLQKLQALRLTVPRRDMRARILRGHKAWSGHHKPTMEDLRELFARHPETTVVTCTRKASSQINDALAQIMRGHRMIIGEVDGDFDANPDNFDENGKLTEGRRPAPARIKLYKGLRIMLTRNLDKKNDFVNGMEAEVVSASARDQCVVVRTKTGKRIAVHLYTDQEETHNNPPPFYPMRVGYASTIYKMQGAELNHVTIWPDKKSMRASLYVAMSRVKHDADYLIGGVCKKEHFLPNA